MKHDCTLEKAAARELADVNQEDVAPEQIVESSYLCAFCHMHDEEADMGNLFGPYVIKAPPLASWPAFLCDKPRSESEIANKALKIFMHARCALWADGLKLDGAKLEDIDEKMAFFWTKKCQICSKLGGSLKCDEGYIHYPCALRCGVKLRRGVFNCSL
uniref:PHD-type domain-containing protein n=1 Tax=Steinernema glaseri TaxID=37863 RepID=A0A1I7Z853_9BILA